ncbi:hypothetical protein [Pseudaminobacter soli (ex Li et al. 2025)]|uniref:Fluoride ion transporter CrcB n=1 Tax=Pseudaminobacter soli (ex Li et al. 2025) TaxID=1295366 RepID=A0A2P7S2F4_9HYPH|nr:hypothetical protein [Mesorhizobium soli]PSJ56650.1 hypothetical protein C7I85_24135 [Mesorhizobium soli]
MGTADLGPVPCVHVAAARFFGTAFPGGTLAVNIVGSLAIGLLAASVAPWGEAAQAPITSRIPANDCSPVIVS